MVTQNIHVPNVHPMKMFKDPLTDVNQVGDTCDQSIEPFQSTRIEMTPGWQGDNHRAATLSGAF